MIMPNLIAANSDENAVEEENEGEELTSFKNGDRDSKIVDLKINLETLGFGSFSKTNFFGPQTEQTVKNLQEYYALTVNGVADEATLAKIKEVLSSSLQNGEHHEDVPTLKEKLHVLGMWSGSRTTFFGSQTEAAVKEFQSTNGLAVSGIAEPVTMSKLEELVALPLQNGMYREDVIRLKEDLEKLGFGSFSKTTFFGPQTERTVKNLQEYYGLTVTGIADETTISKMKEVLSSPLQNGGRHADVVKLKENLNVVGMWPSGSGTTYFGSETEAAVKEFQQANGLVVSGIADPITMEILAKLANRPLQNGMYRQDAVSLKENLETLGFGSFSKTTYYGPQTERAVKNLQKYYGLKDSGVADDATLDKIDEILSISLENHENVGTIKENLLILGMWPSDSEPDLYISQTKAAIRDFQSAYGLPASGIAEPISLGKLSELANGPLQNGMYRDDAVQLKENLETLGFGSFSKTIYFGPQTERALKSLQKYYGLTVSGVAYDATLDKIDEILNSPLQTGRSHEDVVSIKENLSYLGMWPSGSGTPYFGSETEVAVREFQSANDLSVSGILEPISMAKLNELANGPLKNGMYRGDAVSLKEDLETLGFGSFSKTNYYGPQTERTVKNFQSYYGIKVNGIADEQTLSKMKDILSSPLRNGQRHEDTITLKEDLETLGFGSFSKTTFFGPQTEAVVKEFQKQFKLTINGIADQPTLDKIKKLIAETSRKGVVTASSLNVRSGPSTSYNVVGQLSNGSILTIISQHSTGWYEINYNGRTAYVSNNLVNVWSENDLDFSGSHEIGYVTANSLNVRSGPSGSTIDSIPLGTRVEILSTYSRTGQNSWHQIRYDGNKTGYVSAGYIMLARKSSANSGPLTGKTIILDAGHGAQDPGGVGGGMLEKDVVLDISLRAEELLRAAGAEVIMIRRTDMFLSLSQRTFLANRTDADIYVSLHTNIFNGSANGTETFWNSNYRSSDSRKLAHALQDAQVAKMGTRYRRVEAASYYVIRNTHMASALLEVAFMDHSGDAAKLRSNSYRDRSAEGIRDGLINYFK